nr:amidohydrolase family protein [Nitrospirillum iridis]
MDGGGGIVLPGFHDHHLHLLATAARLASVDLSACVDEASVVSSLRQAAAFTAPGGWIRAIGYDERSAGLPDAARLSVWVPHHAVRVQDRTGALWVLNQLALDRLGPAPFPSGVERLPDGGLSGRIWREDAWLRDRLGAQLPNLTPLGAAMLRCGITGVTDAGAGNGWAEAAVLAAARARGEMPQRLVLMGRPDLPPGAGYEVGPVKILYDDRNLPPVEEVAGVIGTARQLGRSVAAHCVTVAELAIYLAALDAAGGARRGDRIEHGALIPEGLLPDIADRGLTIVTQPAFIHDRGDRYLREVEADERGDLYRLASLFRHGVRMAGGSDAPYGAFDPLVAIRAAMTRCTSGGMVLGGAERVDLRRALGLYLGRADDPSTPRWRLMPGDPADICLLAGAESPDRMAVTATLIDGDVRWMRGGPSHAR